MYKGLIEDKICFALDVSSKEEALRFVNMLKDYVGFFKVGMQLFTKEGPSVVEDIIKAGGKVFLDLKYHDIPNTVASTAKEVMSLGVSIFNVHASGGINMLKRTMEDVNEESERLNIERPKVVAVTVLTSINENILRNELGVTSGGLKYYVTHLADMVKYSGLDGIVCSGKETKGIKERLGKDFFVINPGIRLKGCCSEDQKRVTTHIEAIKDGADLLVIGRPIRECINPTGTARKIVSDIENFYIESEGY
jgi:orotidine-5'-phosphate decarboxylase